LAKLTEIAPELLTSDFGVDAVRYHLLRDTRSAPTATSPTSRSWRATTRTSRTTWATWSRGWRRWSAPSAGASVRRPTPTARSARRPKRRASPPRTRGALRPHEALEATWRLIGAANAHLEATEPWKAEPGPAVDAVLGSALEALRIVTLLITPAMPETAEAIWARIGLSGSPAGTAARRRGLGGYPGGLAVEKVRRSSPAQALMDPDPGAAPIWFDSHCHIQDSFAPDDADAAEVLRRRAGALLRCRVGRVVCVGTDLVTSKQALAVCEAASGGAYGRNVPEVYAAIGLHPHEASAGTAELWTWPGRRWAPIRAGLRCHRESGLDYLLRAARSALSLAATSDDSPGLRLKLAYHALAGRCDLASDVLGYEGCPSERCCTASRAAHKAGGAEVEAGMFFCTPFQRHPSTTQDSQ